jgi:hypothetical protein
MSEPIPTDYDELDRWTFQKIGEFIVWFSRLEFALRRTLAEALDLHRDLFDAVTSSYDFRNLCEVTRAACKVTRSERMDEINDLIDRCIRINDDRVKIAHGTWSTTYGALHMSRQKGLKVRLHFTDPSRCRGLLPARNRGGPVPRRRVGKVGGGHWRPAPAVTPPRFRDTDR